MPSETIDELVELSALEGEIESGVSVDIAGARSPLGRRGAINARRRAEDPDEERPTNAPWSAEEEKFLKNNLGKMTLAEIGEALGRSEHAVKIRFTKNGYPAPSKHPDELTNLQMARIIGKCGKSTAMMLERGLIPYRELPTDSDRLIRIVKERDFVRWLINPESWIYFKIERMQPGHYRRLVELAQERWPDEWVTTGQAAEIWGTKGRNCQVINRRIREGFFESARRWGNWWLLRSEVEAKKDDFWPGMGSPGFERGDWTLAGDAFLLLAHGVGITPEIIARMMETYANRPECRLKYLATKDKIGPIMRKRRHDLQGLELVGIRASGVPDLFAPWQLHAHRFPAITRAIESLKNGTTSRFDQRILRGVLRVWAVRFGLDEMADTLRNFHSQAGLQERCEELLAAGVDPLKEQFDG